MPFTQAIKEEFSLKLAIAGIAGVGKSLTSFQIARELAGGERFAVIDTENRKSRKYADEFHFDASDLEIFSIGAYTKEIKSAEEAGYKVLVIDGLSQLWEGKGGIKEMVEMIAKRDKIATFSAWQSGNIILGDFIKMLLESKMHIICTMRSKTEYTSEMNSNNKLQYRRVGLAPIQKDNLEFEFDLFAEMDHEHHMIFQKSLCRKLSGKVLPMAQEGETRKLVAILKKWMEGAPPARQPEPATPTVPAQSATSQSRPTQPETTAPNRQIAQQEPAKNALEAKQQLACKWAERLKVNRPLVEEMDESAIDDKIQQYKIEYQQRQQNAKAEAEARASLAAQK